MMESPRTAVSPAMQDAYAPTPGTTSASHDAAAVASLVISTFAPTRSRAR